MTYRGCQVATVKRTPCEILKIKMKSHETWQNFKLQSCSVCFADFCNGVGEYKKRENGAVKLNLSFLCFVVPLSVILLGFRRMEN